MNEKMFRKMAKALNSSLLDGFRGWLVPNQKGEIIRIEVSDDEFHPQVAYRELSKDPDYEYTSGIGQDCVVDYLELKGATYITRIPTNMENTEFQWSAGYLKEIYNEDIEISGKIMKQSDILSQIITGLGYTTEEYSFTGEKNMHGVPIVDIATIQPTAKKRKPKKNITRKMKPGDHLVYDKFNNLVAVESGGKWHSINNYPELSSKKEKNSFGFTYKKHNEDYCR